MRHLLADQQRHKQVLLNLLSNAVKYNCERGHVFVCARVTKPGVTKPGVTEPGVTEPGVTEPGVTEPGVTEPGVINSGVTASDESILVAGAGIEAVRFEPRLRIEVRDTGPGLSAEDILKLFVPFERLGAARTQIEGIGIGLTLCKRLVEAMNGAIGVDSQIAQGDSAQGDSAQGDSAQGDSAQGSIFWVEMPLSDSPLERVAWETGLEALPEVSQAASTILYIEDNLSNINLIQQVLQEQRHHTRLLTAMQGSVGLELASQHHPDLILLDVHLPDMSGDVVLARLKADAATRGIPVVVLSADATPSQIERLIASGAHDYLTKPLDLKQFFGVIEQLLNRAES